MQRVMLYDSLHRKSGASCGTAAHTPRVVPTLFIVTLALSGADGLDHRDIATIGIVFGLACFLFCVVVRGRDGGWAMAFE